MLSAINGIAWFFVFFIVLAFGLHWIIKNDAGQWFHSFFAVGTTQTPTSKS